MAQVQINTVESETNRTHTGDTNWSIVESIPAASIDAADYIVFCTAWVGGNSHASANFIFEMQEGTTTISNSYGRYKMPNGWGTTNYGIGYHALWKESFGGSSNLTLKQGLVSTTTETVHTLRTNMVMIKVDDTDTAEDALWSGDYEMSQTNTDVAAIANTWVDLEEITIGNGSDDYLIIMVARQSSGSFSGTFDLELNVDGTPQESITRKRAATENTFPDCIMTYLEAPAESIVVKGRARSNGAVGNAITSNAILAIRLNAFDDYAGIHDTDDVVMTSGDTDFAGATLTHTTDHTSASTEDWFFMGWSQINQNLNTNRFEDWLDQGSTTISGNHNNNTWRFTWDDGGAPHGTGGHCLFAEQNMANATDVDVEFGQQEEQAGGPTIETTNIVGFTLEKATPGENTDILVPMGPIR